MARKFYFTIKGPYHDHHIEVHMGEHPRPDLTLSLTEQDYLDIEKGFLRYQMATNYGKLELWGDFEYAKRLQGIIKEDYNLKSVQEAIDTLPDRFVKEESGGLNDIVYQYDLRD